MKRIIILASILSISLNAALAWGPEGHQAVGELASFVVQAKQHGTGDAPRGSMSLVLNRTSTSGALSEPTQPIIQQTAARATVLSVGVPGERAPTSFVVDYLARHVNQVVGRAEIAEHVWDEAFDPFSNLIEVYIQRLRRKIDEGQSLKLIRTLRGEGYMLCSGEPDGHV